MKICIATSTRADWGLLSPLARHLDGCDGAELQILATNMHLQQQYGHTVDEIASQGFEVSARVPMTIDGAGEAARVRGMAQCMAGAAGELSRLKPDMLVILGDRYEMLAIASAAAVMRIPIAHIAGGEVSLGAVDDKLRHAITKLSSLHFAETEEYRQRIVQMGEDPQRVWNAGSLGVWNIHNQGLMTADELEQSLGFAIDPGHLIIATLHPATLEAGSDNAEICRAMLAAIGQQQGYQCIVTYPNNDAGAEEIIGVLESVRDSERLHVVKSLGMRRYLSCLQYAAAVVGNSSSGIIEVPSMHIPTVDIGSRQQGRIRAASVINCGVSHREIADAIAVALSPEMKLIASIAQNPYDNPDTVKIIADGLLNAPVQDLARKPFYDIPSQY